MSRTRTMIAGGVAAALFSGTLLAAAPPAQAADDDCPLSDGIVINGSQELWENDSLIRSDLGIGPATLGAFEVNIPAGRYSITLASFDDHSTPSVPPQVNETWNVQLMTGFTVVATSGTISDVPEDENQLIETVDETIVLPEIDRIRVRHGAWPDETSENSVIPLCIAFEPAPIPPIGLVDTSTGIWRLRQGDDRSTQFYYGNPGDIPFMGDWDCDGVETPGLYRQSDGFVYLRNANSQGNAHIQFFFGDPGDVPLAGDFNDDGCDTVSVYRPSEARFYIINELGANNGGLGQADFSFIFGNPGDKPVVGDWDGDGVDEVGLHRESTGFFYYRNTLTQGFADDEFFFGNPGDRFVAGDWGIVDDVETPAVFRPSNTTFYFRWTNTQGNADDQIVWGQSSWLPVAGDFTLP